MPTYYKNEQYISTCYYDQVSVVEIFTCSQKEHILHNASLCRYVICNDTSLVQHNLSDTEGGMEGVEVREEEGESG